MRNGKSYGQRTANTPVENMTPAQAYIAAHQKSKSAAVLIALLFGPIGLMYASPIGGLVAVLVTIVIVPTLGVIGWAIMTVISVLLAAPLAASSNEKVSAMAHLLAR